MTWRKVLWSLVVLLLAAVVFIDTRVPTSTHAARLSWIDDFVADYTAEAKPLAPVSPKCAKILDSARGQTHRPIDYDASYVRMSYPNGDVPSNTGVCADVIVRSLRTVGLDLQKAVHEDMKANGKTYPNLWGLLKPDSNIDHRRVPNLMVYFKSHSQSLPLSQTDAEYAPCDIVAWDLGSGVTHIGIVSDRKGISGHPMIIHHIGGHPNEVDHLFSWRVIGHFRL